MLSVCSVFSQSKDQGIRVFIDCNADCDFDYIKTEINYVDFVPDRFTSNVYIMVTSQETGSGGEEINMYFSGQQQFKGMEDTLKFNFGSTTTEDEDRKQMVQYLKLGLMRFISKTSLAEKISINANQAKGDKPLNAIADKKDPWNSWVFNIRFNGSLDKDDYSQAFRYSTGIESSRITEKLKINNSIYYNKSERTIDIDGTSDVYPNSSYGAYTSIVKSVNDHLSYGGAAGYNYSTYNNYKSEITFMPAIEYSVYPYKDAVKKAITIYYEIGHSWNQYIDSSYYGLLKDNLVKQALSASVGFTQKWGNIRANASWESFLNSFVLEKKHISGTNINRFSLNGNVELRIFKGLSFNMYLGSEFTKGVFPNLRLKDFDRDDILAGVRQYPTTNRFYLFFGLNYRFGSIYNNVVNPRFDQNRFF